MKHTVVSAVIFLAVIGLLHAEETYNLEIIFKRTNWEPDSIRLYGNALSTAGDVNQDGYDDIVYSVFFDNWYGYGYVYFGGDPMDTFPDIILQCEAVGMALMSICAGDVNGDSISDVIIGEGQAGNWGKVFIYYGGVGMDSLPDMTLHGEPLDAWPFGVSVACGDVNGDSWDDIVVGSYDNGDLDGRVYVYYGGALLDSLPDVIIEGHNSESMGITVGSGGDLNSDGFEDIVVGAYSNSEAGTWAGKVYVFFGGNPMNTIPDCWLHGEGAQHFLGTWGVAVSEASSNYDLMITGTRSYPGGFPGYYPGKIYVMFGGSPMDTIVDLWKVGETDSSWLGNWVAGAKVDSSVMYGDFLAGAPVEYQFNGRGYVWAGNTSIDSMYDAYLEGDNSTEIGWKVASAGDVDGDGYDEVMFSNYAGVNPTVWVCRYTGPGIQEHASQIAAPFMHIEPNPFSHILNIDYNNGRDNNVNMRIFDVSGREVMRHVLKDKTRVSVDTRSLPGGVYFVEVRAGLHRVVEKAVKIK